MFKLALALLQRLGGTSGMAIFLACLTPFALMQCSHSRLQSLRAEHQSLKTEYAALEARLESCREAAGLHDAVLAARERETMEINNKYKRLREDFLRHLVPVEKQHEQSAQIAEEAATARIFQDWCVQPVPPLVRGLLANPEAARALPGTPGAAPAGD